MNSKTLVVLIAMLSVSTATRSQSLQDFKWLIGHWQGQSDGASISEQWKQVDENTFTGNGLVVAGKDTVASETMLLRIIGDKIVYIATVNGNDPVLFTFRSKNSRNEYVFENKEHDFPQRIVYAPATDGSLTAWIEGKMNGKDIKEVYSYKRL